MNTGEGYGPLFYSLAELCGSLKNLREVMARDSVLRFTCSEDVGTGITAQCEVVVMAVGTIRFLILASKRSINQRHFAVNALEAVLMPVLVLVRQILQATLHCSVTYRVKSKSSYTRSLRYRRRLSSRMIVLIDLLLGRNRGRYGWHTT